MIVYAVVWFFFHAIFAEHGSTYYRWIFERFLVSSLILNCLWQHNVMAELWVSYLRMRNGAFQPLTTHEGIAGSHYHHYCWVCVWSHAQQARYRGKNGTFQHEEPLFENRPLLFYVINMLMSPCAEASIVRHFTVKNEPQRKEIRYFELFIGLESFNDVGFAGCVDTVSTW